MSLLPEVGCIGLWSLKTPFAALLKPNTTYNCQAVRKIKEILAEGEEPFEDYYVANNLSQALYDADVAAGECIVSLQSGSGEWIHVPTSYVLSYPIMNGVKYRGVMMGINLSALPDNKDLSLLKTKMIDLVLGTVGVSPVIKEIAITPPVILSKQDSDAIETARRNRISIIKTDAQKIAEYELQISKLNYKVTELENFIKAKVLTP